MYEALQLIKRQVKVEELISQSLLEELQQGFNRSRINRVFW
jgi:hypothetical protein